MHFAGPQQSCAPVLLQNRRRWRRRRRRGFWCFLLQARLSPTSPELRQYLFPEILVCAGIVRIVWLRNALEHLIEICVGHANLLCKPNGKVDTHVALLSAFPQLHVFQIVGKNSVQHAACRDAARVCRDVRLHAPRHTLLVLLGCLVLVFAGQHSTLCGGYALQYFPPLLFCIGNRSCSVNAGLAVCGC